MSGAERFDVAVVGGGSAGVAAAVTAARLGARTLLVERAGELGGNASQALVHTICGLYRPAAEGHAVHAHPGLPRAFAERLRRAGAAGDPERAGRVFYLPTEPAALAREALALVNAVVNLEVRLAAALTSAEGGAPHALVLARGGVRETALAHALVDASGDAALAAALGADVAEEAPDVLQHPSYIFRVAGVETAELEGFARLQLSAAVAGAARSGTLASGGSSIAVRPALRAGEIYVTLNVEKPCDADYDPLDDAQRRALEEGARRHAEALLAHLRATRSAFRAARVSAWPARLGIRETRRVRGRVELSREDVLAGRRRADEVALSTWPIELWSEARRARFLHPEAPCSVPLGSLQSRSHPRLAAAGRCMAGSHEALGALRVIGTALATGEAAGAAAALAADAGADLHAVPPAAVRDAVARLAQEPLP